MGKSKTGRKRQLPARPVRLLAAAAAGHAASGCAFAQTAPAPGETERRKSSAPDSQFRGQAAISAPLYRGVRLTLRTDLRLARVIPDDRFLRGEIGLLYSHRLNPHLSLVPRYRYRATDEFGGPTEREHRFSLNGVVDFGIGSLSVRNENLLEHRRRGRGPETRYRNRLRLAHPARLGGQEVELFISDEAFYDWTDSGWTRNRFRVGLSRPLSRQVEIELHYLRQWDKFEQPGRIDALGIELEIDLEEK